MSNLKVPVTVEVADLASPLEILDGVFRVVAQGFGRISTELAPGLYKARTQVGAAVQDKLFAVDEGSPPLPVLLDPVAFSSPAPLHDTSTTHEYHQHAVSMAASNSEQPLSLGKGSSLLLSIRDASNAPFELTDQSRDAYARSFDGFSLCAADGSELINYDQAAKRDIDQGFAIRNVELDPGHYILKVQRAGLEPMALPVVTVMGWASQIFIFFEEGPWAEVTRRPLLQEAAVMMVPLGQSFHPDDHYFRLTEVARQALQRGRNILDGQIMDKLLDSKFGNPVLGLFAAYLLLLDPKPPLDLLRIVVDNLNRLLGFDFPDVIALRCRLQQLESSSGAAGINQDPMVFPPMLRTGWEIVASLAVADDDILPAGSVSREISDRLTDNGIWMAWRPRPPQAETPNRSVLISDDQLEGKQWRDQKDILAVFDKAKKALDTDAGHGMLQKAKTLAKRVMGKKLLPYIKSVGGNKSHHLDHVRKLVIRLAQDYPWEDLIGKLNELDYDGAISERLSSVQKSLIPALMLLRQQMDAGEEVSQDRWEQLFASFQLPRSVLLDNLWELARLAIVVKKEISTS